MTSSLFEALQQTGLATAVREDWFPYIESVHVLALATVIGAVFLVDFRLLGICLKHVRFHDLSAPVLFWAWTAFCVAAVTGSLLFISNADHYLRTWTFLVKLGLIALAGINMLAFHFWTGKQALEWDTGPLPAAARLSGAISVLLWVGVVAAGRWTGFLL